MTPKHWGPLALIVLTVSAVFVSGSSSGDSHEIESSSPTRLAILWSSGDPEVAHRVALMYAHAAKRSNWFDDVRLVIWGPSARLLAADKDLQAKVSEMRRDGVDVKACVVCADSYGVSQLLRKQGIEVLPMGEPLTTMLKSDWKIVTF